MRDLRAAVREAALLTLPDEGRLVTACIGTGCFPADGDSVDALMTAATRSLVQRQTRTSGKREQADSIGARHYSQLKHSFLHAAS